MSGVRNLKRNDVLVNYWVAVLGAVHWFNPVAWWCWPAGAGGIRELACDEQVVSGDGGGGGVWGDVVENV